LSVAGGESCVDHAGGGKEKSKEDEAFSTSISPKKGEKKKKSGWRWQRKLVAGQG